MTGRLTLHQASTFTKLVTIDAIDITVTLFPCSILLPTSLSAALSIRIPIEKAKKENNYHLFLFLTVEWAMPCVPQRNARVRLLRWVLDEPHTSPILEILGECSVR